MPVPLVNIVEFRQVLEILDSFAPRYVVDRALREAGINRDVLRSGPGFLPYLIEVSVFESVARKLGDRSLGTLAGQKFDYNGFEGFAKYVLAAPTLSDALVRSRKAIRLLHTNARFSLRRSGDNLVFGYRSGLEGVVGYRHLSEATIFLITYVFRYFLGQDWRPKWIELIGKNRFDEVRLSDLTGVEVRAGADILAIAVPIDDLFAINPVPSDVSEIVTIDELPILMGVTQPETTSDMVKEVMRAQLILGDLSEDSVARRLSVGPRTLQRLLMVEGVSFRELRNRFIEGRARGLLCDSDLTINQIAKSLGYSEPNSFRRAFRNWTGDPPSRFRQRRGGE